MSYLNDRTVEPCQLLCFLERLMSVEPNQAIAIIEREYLIAIDLERIIKENFSVEVHVIMPEEACDKLTMVNCDVIILDAELDNDIIRDLIPVIEPASASVVLLTVSEINPEANVPFTASCEISKPFTDEQVIDAMRKVLTPATVQRQKPPGQTPAH